MRRHAIRRDPEVEESPVPASNAATSEGDSNDLAEGTQPALTKSGKPQVVSNRPSDTAEVEAKAAAKAGASSDRVGQVAPASKKVAPEPKGPIRVVIDNAKPAEPLTGEQRRLRSIQNLQSIGRALGAHVQRTGALPTVIRDEQGKPLLSWRVALLPDLGYGELYRQFHLDQAWNHPWNEKLLAQIPPEFQSPERFDRRTNYLGLAGSGQAFAGPRGAVPSAMEDGSENTVLVIEVDDGRAANWTAPDDFVPATGSSRSGLGRLRGDGVFALLGNGRVVRLGPDLPDSQFLALFSPDGGEQVSTEDLSEPTRQAAEIAVAPAVEPFAASVPESPVGKPADVATTPAASSPAAPPEIALPGEPSLSSNPDLLPVPPEEALAAARALFRELYGKQYDQARSWDDKAKLAKQLLADVAKVKANPAHYYELLRIVRDVAAAGGDADSAHQAAEYLTERFQIDGLAMRLKLLEDLSKSPRKTETVETLRKIARELLLDAFDADRFDVAIPAYDRLVEFTRLKGERGELSRLTQSKQPLEAARQAYVAACAAVETLKANPDDGAASETLGKYLCFVKNRWDAGLPYLVRAAEVQLRVVATIDRETARSPHDTLSLADHYWEMANDYKQPFSRGLHLRSALCYQTALDQLPDGLEKLKAQKRIDEVGEIYSPEEVARALNRPVRAAARMEDAED
ncbi:MAG TPA: DUF1559 domain-containing protein [Pirellulaceae bacterium]|nr:DUF1559 domain-containing protein [Pirellulaceae bacterium]